MTNYITIKMQYETDIKHNGGVAEIIGFHERFNYDFDWEKKPKIIKHATKKASGIQEFKLYEGKIYFIKHPYGSQKPKYVKIENSQMRQLRMMEVKKLLEESLLPTTTETRNHRETQSFKNQENQLHPDVTFILENLDEAFVAKETLNGDSIFAGMSIVTYNFAVKQNLKEEWVLIKENLEYGKTVEEIKKLLLAKSITETKPTRVFDIEKYKAII